MLVKKMGNIGVSENQNEKWNILYTKINVHDKFQYVKNSEREKWWTNKCRQTRTSNEQHTSNRIYIHHAFENRERYGAPWLFRCAHNCAGSQRCRSSTAACPRNTCSRGAEASIRVPPSWPWEQHYLVPTYRSVPCLNREGHEYKSKYFGQQRISRGVGEKFGK